MWLTGLPPQTREMPLSEFKQLYPDDFQTGAIAQIGQKFAAMKEELAAKQVPATGRGARTAAKRAAEPETALRTTRRRVATQAPVVELSDMVTNAARRPRSRAAAEDGAAADAPGRVGIWR